MVVLLVAESTGIEWTDATWNPVTGCDKVSPGCKFCYAERFSERFRGVEGHHFEQGFDLRLWPDRLDQPQSWKKPRRVFVNSMSDLFHEDVPDEFIHEVFGTMVEADRHIYQILTKRPERMRDLADDLPWPDHVWAGVSVENNDYLSRVDVLREVPANIRFLSCEPLIGPLPDLDLEGIHWVIVGGESGPNHRPIDPEWVRSIRDQCRQEDVPFFFKQWGGQTPKARGRELDGRTWDEFPDELNQTPT